MQIVQGALCRVQCAGLSLQPTQPSVQYSMGSVQYSVCTLIYGLCSVQGEVKRKQSELYSRYCISPCLMAEILVCSQKVST